MRSSRHGLATRFIMLLLAAAMPLCCCVMRSMAEVPPSNDAPGALSCCATPATCENGEQTPADDAPSGCNGYCCIKAPVTVDDWTPPIDLIGEPSDGLIEPALLTIESASVVTPRPNRPPPGPWGCSAPAWRHATILQV